jgi:hypothetical protein
MKRRPAPRRIRVFLTYFALVLATNIASPFLTNSELASVVASNLVRKHPTSFWKKSRTSEIGYIQQQSQVIKRSDAHKPSAFCFRGDDRDAVVRSSASVDTSRAPGWPPPNARRSYRRPIQQMQTETRLCARRGRPKLKDEPRSRTQLSAISHLGSAHPPKTISGRAVRVADDA